MLNSQHKICFKRSHWFTSQFAVVTQDGNLDIAVDNGENLWSKGNNSKGS